MKDLYNVIESIFDREETIIDRVTKGAELAASADWLQDHGIKGCTQGVSRPDIHKNMFKDQDPSQGIWQLPHNVLFISKKDKDIPSFVKINSLLGLVIQDYPGETLPDFGLINCSYVTIMNCPNLKSLHNCPVNVNKFSISGCPKITSLDAAPKIASELFKVIRCGKKFTYNDIKRVCVVDKNDAIY